MKNRYREEYLPQDFQQALAEGQKVWASLSNVENLVIDGKLQEAKLETVELLNSLDALEKLQAKKRRHEKLMAVVEELTSKGILIGFVTRK
jgi:hypothetical protein